MENCSIESAAALTVDDTAPTNQDVVFAASISKNGGAAVTIVSSGDAANNVWFAPSSTTVFFAGPTMTTASGVAVTILAPIIEGSYKMYVIDVVGNCSMASAAALTVDDTAPTNQDVVFAASISKKGGTAVTIVSSGDAANNVWFAPSSTTVFSAGPTMTTASGTAVSILAPITEGSYKMYVIDAAENCSIESAAALKVDDTAPIVSTVSLDVGSPVNAGSLVTFTITFDEVMNTSIVPIIKYGVLPPFTDNNIIPKLGAAYTNGYIIADTKVWEGTAVLTVVGDYTISIAGADDLAGNILITDDTYTFAVSLGAANKIVFINIAQTITAGGVSGLYTVQVQDAYDNLRSSDALTLTLSSSSGEGMFDTSAGGSFDGTITSITTSLGEGTFYYKDTIAGIPTITVAKSGLTSGTQAQVIKHTVPDHLRFSMNIADPQIAGISFVLPALEAVDVYGNIADNSNGSAAYEGAKTISYFLSGVSDSPDGEDFDSWVTTDVVFTNGESTTVLDTILYYAQNITITASVPDLTGVNEVSNLITVNSEAGIELIFKQVPSYNGTINVSLPQQPIIAIQDVYGNQTLGTDLIMLWPADTSYYPSFMAAGGELVADGDLSGNPVMLNAVNGEVQYSNLKYNTAVSIYLYAESGSLTPVFSAASIDFSSSATSIIDDPIPVSNFSLVPTKDDISNKFEVLRFTIEDQGEDGINTLVDQVKIAVTGPSASTDIAWAGLSYTGLEVPIAAISITNSEIVFGNAPNNNSSADICAVSDSSALEITVYIYMRDGTLIAEDKQAYTFGARESLIGIDTGMSSQMMGDTGNVSIVTGTIMVDIIGDPFQGGLLKIEGPSTATAGAITGLTIKAADSNGNIDKDYIGIKNLVFSGLNSIGSYIPKVNGVNFPNRAVDFAVSPGGSSNINLIAYKKEIGMLIVGDTGQPAFGCLGLTITVNDAGQKRIAYESGNNQTGAVDSTLAEMVKVKVKDEFDNSVEGVNVNFSITPSGTVTSGSTDSGGFISTLVALGGTSGNYTIEATGQKLDFSLLTGAPIVFTATAVEAGFLQESSGSGQSGEVNLQLSPFVVVLLGLDGVTPIANETINFTVIQDPSGAAAVLSALSCVTDNSGIAQTTLTLGDKSGQYIVRASYPPFTLDFDAVAVAAIPDKVVLSGPGSVKAGEISAVFTLFVQDQYDNNKAVSMDTVFSLTAAGTFYDSLIQPIVEVTVNSGADHAEFYYENSVNGVDLIIAQKTSGQALNDTDDSVSITVTPADLGYFTVTASDLSALIAGIARSIDITAYDVENNVKTDFIGDWNIIFSGANSSPAGRAPTCSDKNNIDLDFGQNTNLTFTLGTVQTTLKLYNVESSVIKAVCGMGTPDSADLELIVQPAVEDHLKFENNLSFSQLAGQAFAFGTRLIVLDQYENICEGYSGVNAITWDLSGQDNSPDGLSLDSFTNPVSFTNGYSTTALSTVLYRAQDTTINAVVVAWANIVSEPSNPIVVQPAAASRLEFIQGSWLTSCITTQPLTPDLKVAVMDQYGNVIIGAVQYITLNASLSGDPFIPVSEGILTADMLTVGTIAGVAEFKNVTYNYPENIYVRAVISGSPFSAIYSPQITFKTAQEAVVSNISLGIAGDTISSLAGDFTSRESVLKFNITDGGTDGYRTKIKQIIMKRSADDTTGGWSDYIAAAYITDGISQNIASVEDNRLIFGSGSNIIYEVENTNNKTFTVSVFLKNSLPSGVDNQILGFSFDADLDVALQAPCTTFPAADAIEVVTAITVLATNFIITGDSEMEAGANQDIIIRAVDVDNNVDKDYEGDVALEFRGAEISPNGSYLPSCTNFSGIDVDFGNPTVVSFIQGSSSSVIAMMLYKRETAVIKAKDDMNGIDTFDEKALTVTVLGAVASRLYWETEPISVAVVNAPWKDFSIALTDMYGNVASSQTTVKITMLIGAIPDGAESVVIAQEGIANFKNFFTALPGTVQVRGEADGVTSTPYSSPIIISDSYDVTIKIKDYTTGGSLTDISLTVLNEGIPVFEVSGNSPFEGITLPYGVYTLSLDKDKYLQENIEKKTGFLADGLDGVYDNKITWNVIMTSLSEASADYHVMNSFVYDEVEDTLFVRMWLERRGKLIISDITEDILPEYRMILGESVVHVYEDNTVAAPLITTLNLVEDPSDPGIFYKKIKDVIAVGGKVDLIAGKSYYAKGDIEYGNLQSKRIYQGAVTFTISISKAMMDVTRNVEIIALDLKSDTKDIKKGVSDVMDKLEEEAANIKSGINSSTSTIQNIVSQQTNKILLATGETSLPEMIGDVKNEILAGVVPHVKSGILNTQSQVKRGDTLVIRYKADLGLSSVNLNVFDPQGEVKVDGVRMEEVGNIGVYEYAVEFRNSWGIGDFSIYCSEQDYGTMDGIVITVVEYDIRDVATTTAAILGTTSKLSKFDKAAKNLEGQISMVEMALTQLGRSERGKDSQEGGTQGKEGEDGVYAQLLSISKQIKDLGGTDDIDLEAVYNVANEKKNDMIYLKNKTEELKATMDLSKKMMDNVANKPITQSWYEFR
ncbi:MAG: hypothetical protein ABIH71_01210 [Candidatus Omnitrophota bacterium]